MSSEAGAVLHRNYRGAEYEIVVRSDGRLVGDGEVFDSPSQARRRMTGQKAVNGWVFWLTDSEVPLAELRQADPS